MTEPAIDAAPSAAITIRAATDNDLPRMTAILYDDPPMEMKAVVPDLAKARRIGALILRYGLEATVARTVLAVIDGEAVGLMETMRPDDAAHVSPLTVLAVLARGMLIVGPQGLLRYARYQSARAQVQVERVPGSYYIAELDVHPNHRNRGIGATLLRHAERGARDEGFAQMSLATSITNPAQHLYVRQGYRIIETRRDARYEQLTGIPGRLLMVKELG